MPKIAFLGFPTGKVRLKVSQQNFTVEDTIDLGGDEVVVPPPAVDLPVAVDDNATVQVGGRQEIIDILSNDSGLDRKLVSVTPKGSPSGTLDSFDASGQVFYTPPSGGGATSDVFDYVVRTGDGTKTGGDDTGSLTIAVREAPPAGSGTVKISSFAGRTLLGQKRTTGTAPAPFFFSAVASGFGVEDHYFDVRYKWTFEDPGYYDANDTDDFPWDRLYDVDGKTYICRGPDVYLEDGGTLHKAGGAALISGIGYVPTFGTKKTYLGIDKNVAYGPHVVHIFSEPGTYTVKCEVQKRGELPVVQPMTITVLKPDTVFPGSDTIVFSPSSNWGGAPNGAQRVTTWASAKSAAESGSNKRILVHRDAGSFTGDMPSRSAGWQNLQVGVYGSGSNRPYRPGGSWHLTNAYVGGQISIWGIDVTGSYDVEDPWGTTRTGGGYTYSDNDGITAIWDCRVGKVERAFEVRPSTGLTQSFGLILGNVRVYDWSDHYGFFGDDDLGYSGLCGCFFKQNPNAIMGSRSTSQGAHPYYARSAALRFAALKAPFAINVGWFRSVGDYTSVSGAGFQPPLRVSRGGGGANKVFEIEEGNFERILGENATIYGNGNASTDQRPRRFLWDKTICASTWHSSQIVPVGTAGIHIRNAVMTMAGRKMGGWLNEWIRRAADAGTSDHASTRNYGFDLYNFTLIDLRTSNYTDTWYDSRMDTGSGGLLPFGWVKIGNGLMEHTALTSKLETGDGPFDETIAWKKTLDAVRVESVKRDTSYALPANVGALWIPKTRPPLASTSHSNAGNGQGSRIAVDDLFGRVRPTGATRGAVESS